MQPCQKTQWLQAITPRHQGTGHTGISFLKLNGTAGLWQQKDIENRIKKSATS